MRKIAFIFPGQGAQKVGMGNELVDNFKEGQEIFTTSDKALGFPLSQLCREGPEEDLRLTINTQPAIVATSIACFKILSSRGISPLIVAGHSVGEYSALVAAGVLNFEDAIRLVRKRGELMHEAGTTSLGTMAAVIGLDHSTIKDICNKIAGTVEVANFNSPEQIVISGAVDAVKAAMEACKEKGARRVLPLNVSAAFHSSLMKSAALKLSAELDKTKFMEPQMPVVANISARALKDAESIKEALKKQILGSVLWTDTIKTAISLDVDTFVEVGPGKALSGMIRKTDKYVKVCNVEDLKSLEKTLDSLKEEAILRK